MQEKGALADFGLPTTSGTATARSPCRVDRDMPDLAPVAGGTGHRLAIDDDPAAHAHLS